MIGVRVGRKMFKLKIAFASRGVDIREKMRLYKIGS